MGAGRQAVSIICVFNHASVREHCLDGSIERHRPEVDDLDYVVVDNRDGTYPSAGAAFNAGASRAGMIVVLNDNDMSIARRSAP